MTAGVWQTNTLDDDTLVYQTNAAGGFCLVDPFTPCTFADFKAQYPEAVVLGLTVAIGSGIPVTTSYVDGISLTIDGVTDTWDFELAAAPTTAPTDPATPLPAGATVPPTDLASPATASPDGRWSAVRHPGHRERARTLSRYAPIAAGHLTDPIDDVQGPAGHLDTAGPKCRRLISASATCMA